MTQKISAQAVVLLIAVILAIAPLAAQDAVPDEAPSQATLMGQLIRSTVLREEPTEESDYSRTLPVRTQVAVIGEEQGQVITENGITSDLWLQVRVDQGSTNAEGYVWSGYVEVQESTLEEQSLSQEGTSERVSEVHQISLNELGEYTSGIRLTIDGKTWEFVTDMPGVTFDPETTDSALLSEQLISLMNVDPQRYYYYSPNTHSVRVIIGYEREFHPTHTFNDSYGINSPDLSTPGIQIEPIHYTDKFIDDFKNPLFFPDESHQRMFLNYIILQQLYYGGRFGEYYNYEREPNLYLDLYHQLGLPDNPSLEQMLETFRGIGVQFDPDLPPTS